MPTNALVHEKSPYLRQHAHNPVDWMPWGDEAFTKAKREDKPIFLSIGYSTCHWCHVMAHESFEDQAVADLLNRDFVSIKIDREERPDVDRIYMLFVQASTGSGGWPMSVWLTPERRPFFGGTYYPPDGRYGRPGFGDLLRHLANAWRTDRAKIEESSQSVLQQLQTMIAQRSGESGFDEAAFASAWPSLRRSFDSTYGGFGAAPKFPRPVTLNYLFRFAYREKNDEAASMAIDTLSAMARGGMCDQLGGGFHRYSVDERWFVPHFEKMLYDQAQLAVSYLEGFQITKDRTFARVAEDIFGYVLRDMTNAQGGFYSAEDADSPDPDNPTHSGEGAFYIWRQAEIEALLSPSEAAAIVCSFGVQPDGNVEQDPHNEFGGRNILYQAMSASDCALRMGQPVRVFEEELRSATAKLFERRRSRPRPHLDNKILTAWNASMISAFVAGFRILGKQEYLSAAERALSFLLSRLRAQDGQGMLRRFCDDEAAVPAFLDDYAFLSEACLDLFEATSKAEYLKEAIAFGGIVMSFADAKDGGFFSTDANAPDLVFRMKDDYDGAEPSGNSIATNALLRLAHLTNNDGFQAAAEKALEAAMPRIRLQPTASPQMLVALGRYQSAAQQTIVRCAVVDEEIEAVLRKEQQAFLPYTATFALSDEEAGRLREIAPFLSSLQRNGRYTIYRCHNFTCELPEDVA